MDKNDIKTFLKQTENVVKELGSKAGDLARALEKDAFFLNGEQSYSRRLWDNALFRQNSRNKAILNRLNHLVCFWSLSFLGNKSFL